MQTNLPASRIHDDEALVRLKHLQMYAARGLRSHRVATLVPRRIASQKQSDY